MFRAPIDGSPAQPFWTSKLARFHPGALMPDSSGGWIVEGEEPFDDGAIHASVWLLDAQQRGTRLACDPTAGGLLAGLSRPNALSVAPDAAYVTISHPGCRLLPREMHP